MRMTRKRVAPELGMKIEQLTNATHSHSVAERLPTDRSSALTCTTPRWLKKLARAHYESLVCFHQRGECTFSLVRPYAC